MNWHWWEGRKTSGSEFKGKKKATKCLCLYKLQKRYHQSCIIGELILARMVLQTESINMNCNFPHQGNISLTVILWGQKGSVIKGCSLRMALQVPSIENAWQARGVRIRDFSLLQCGCCRHILLILGETSAASQFR